MRYLSENFMDKLLNNLIEIISIRFDRKLIKIVNPEMILKAATTIISERIINITFLSTLSALKSDLFKSDQV